MTVKRIIIDVTNLSESEQLRLWDGLFLFARKDLPETTILKVYIEGDKIQ